MLKRTLVLLVASVALLSFACSSDDDDPGGDDDTSPTATAASSTTDGEDTTAAATDVSDDAPSGACGENPDPATDEFVQVTTPQDGDSVTSPLTVEGAIAAFEAAFSMAVLDADGTALGVTNGMSSEGQTLAPFSQTIEFGIVEETPACLWVYENSARDGQPIHVRQIELLLQP